MEQNNPYTVQLADVAIETGANLEIKYGPYKMQLPLDCLKEMKEKGIPSNIISCIGLCMLKNGKTQEEVIEILNTGDKKEYHISVTFTAPDGGALNISTPDKAPVLDQLVQCVTNS